jgi:hypothetical protein
MCLSIGIVDSIDAPQVSLLVPITGIDAMIKTTTSIEMQCNTID